LALNLLITKNIKGGVKMYKVINSWIEYIHPKLGCIEIARIEDEKKIKEKGHIIVKKVINMECIYSSEA